MAKFPEHRHENIVTFMQYYMTERQRASNQVDKLKVAHATRLITDCIELGKTIFVCGNGGSAAISNHLECDFAKGIATSTLLHPKIVSLCRTELITAYGNDENYGAVFWRQLEQAARSGDLLIAMSASGKSSNVLNAASFHNATIGSVISFTGFDGGELASASTANIHVDSENYGICENIFQDVMHMIAQYIRHDYMDPVKIKGTKF